MTLNVCRKDMDCQQKTIALSFPQKPVAEASKISNALESQISRDLPELNFHKIQTSPNNMDMGSTIVMVLGAPAVVTIAAGISAVLHRFKAKVTIKADGEIVAENVSAEDVAKIIERLFDSN